MRILGVVVQALMLSVFDAWEQFSFGRSIAFEFVGHDDARREAGRLEQFAEELLRRLLVAVALQQDIEDLTVGIHGPPEVILLPLNGDHNLVKMPLVSGLGATATNLIRVGMSKLFTPLVDRFVGDLNAQIEHHFLNIPKAQRKGVVEPDAVTNDRDGKAVVFVADAHGLTPTDADKGYHES